MATCCGCKVFLSHLKAAGLPRLHTAVVTKTSSWTYWTLLNPVEQYEPWLFHNMNTLWQTFNRTNSRVLCLNKIPSKRRWSFLLFVNTAGVGLCQTTADQTSSCCWRQLLSISHRTSSFSCAMASKRLENLETKTKEPWWWRSLRREERVGEKKTSGSHRLNHRLRGGRKSSVFYFSLYFFCSFRSVFLVFVAATTQISHCGFDITPL